MGKVFLLFLLFIGISCARPEGSRNVQKGLDNIYNTDEGRTNLVGDFLFVNKLDYSERVPRKPFKFPDLMDSSGSYIHMPGYSWSDSNVIKRMVAKPEDTFKIN